MLGLSVTVWKLVALAGALKCGLLAWLMSRRWRRRATPNEITLDPVSDNWLTEQRRQK
jgi:hypothetical protein